MNPDLLAHALAASALACAVTTAGIYVIGRYSDWAKRNAVYFMSFAAGVLISVSFVHIIPKSFDMSASAPIYLLGGFMGLHLFNRFLAALVCDRQENRDLQMGLVPMIGIGFHSMIDGMIYTVTFNVDMFTGVVAAIGTVLHEFPEGIVTFVLLDRAGFGRRKSAVYAFLAAGLSTPVGTVLSYPLVRTIGEETLGTLLAVSAGALVYVGASHLLPAVEKEDKGYTILTLAAGILVAAGIVLS